MYKKARFLYTFGTNASVTRNYLTADIVVHYMAWLNAALFICLEGNLHNRLLYVPTAEHRCGPQGIAREERRLARKTGT